MAKRRKASSDSILVTLKDLSKEITEETQKELWEYAEKILWDAIGRIDSKSGDLAASGRLEWTKNKTAVKIVFDATHDNYKYGKIIEFRPGHEHPFLYPAYDAYRDAARNAVIGKIQKAVKQFAKP